MQLGRAFTHLQQTYLNSGELGLSETQIATLLYLDKLAQQRAKEPSDLDTLARSDLEDELETWFKNPRQLRIPGMLRQPS